MLLKSKSRIQNTKMSTKKMVNNFAQKLFIEYIRNAPDFITNKYSCGTPKYIFNKKGEKIINPKWTDVNSHTISIFNGIIFSKNNILLINIYIYSEENNYKPEYLNITNVFQELLKHYNIFHLALIITTALKPLYKESSLANNVVENINNIQVQQLKKLKGRHTKFIAKTKNDINQKWHTIIMNAISKITNLQEFKKLKNKKPYSPFFYNDTPILKPYKYKKIKQSK